MLKNTVSVRRQLVEKIIVATYYAEIHENRFQRNYYAGRRDALQDAIQMLLDAEKTEEQQLRDILWW